MFLKVVGDIVINTNTNSQRIRSGYAYGGKLYTVESASSFGRFRAFDLKTLKQLYTEVTTLNSPVAITLINTASAVVGSSTATSSDLIELSSGNRTNISSGAIDGVTSSTSAAKGQQLAGDITNNVAIGVKSGAGTVVKYTLSGSTLSAATTSGISGITGTLKSIIHKTGSSAFITGDSAGKVYELSAALSVTKTITLPTTPNIGVAPTWVVTGLSYDADQDKLICLTSSGVYFVYTYSTSTELTRGYMCHRNQGTNGALGSCLCPSFLGSTFFASNYTRGTTRNAFIQEFNFTNLGFEDVAPIDISDGQTAEFGIDTSIGYFWAILEPLGLIRVWKLDLRSAISIPTLAFGVDGEPSAARIIRIDVSKMGQAYVQSDDDISAAETFINSPKDRTFLELALYADNTWDIRKVTT